MSGSLMSESTKCPSSAELRLVLDGNESDPGMGSIVSHLDHCSCCQQSLEEMANSDSSFAKTLLEQVAVQKPEATSAYWPAFKKVEQAGQKFSERDTPRSSPEVSLGFLTPSEDGEGLGSLAHFKVLRVVGRGGMGVVLHAIDTCLERDVAVKILDPELAKDETARTRFCREARAAASINHENVVAVYQVEHEEGNDLPFLVMELISGQSLEAKLQSDGRLPLMEIVRIGMQTASGLAAAHDRGLVHRDIKPGNILLEKAGQRVKLTDFGLARAADDLKLTRSGLVAGTPLYMSPEQASGDELDARSDLFSLGVVLYELAAGQPPFHGKTPLAVLKRLTEEKHPPLRQLNPDLPDWFIQMVDRLLAKKPSDRFQSAREVAETLEHFWASLISSAGNLVCPKKRAAHFWRTVLLGAFAGLLTLAIGGVALYFAMPRLLTPAPQSGEVAEAKIPMPAFLLKGNSGPLWALAFSRDGKTLAMGTDEGTVKVWDVDSERVEWTLNAHKAPVWTLALSPRGNLLATGSDDGQAHIWDLKTRKEAHSLPNPGGARALAFDPTGAKLLMGNRNGVVKLWDTQTGMEILQTAGHSGSVVAAAFSPDGKTMATASGDKTIKMWDAATGEEKMTLKGHQGSVFGIAFSPTQPILASGGWDRSVRLWDLNSGSEIAKLEGPTQDVWSVAFSPDGTQLASTGEDQIVRIWDVASHKEVNHFRGSTGAIYGIRYSIDPLLLATAGRDGSARIWRLPVANGK